MIFDNKKHAIRIYLRKMIIAGITVLILIGIMVSAWFENDVLGLQKYSWVLIVTIVYILTVVVSRLRKLNFFYFSDEGDKLIVRYYPIHPLVQKKKAIQIPKIGLIGYKINRSMMGLRKEIIFQQSVKGKIANYPPIGITALRQKEIDQISKQIDKYVRP